MVQKRKMYQKEKISIEHKENGKSRAIAKKQEKIQKKVTRKPEEPRGPRGGPEGQGRHGKPGEPGGRPRPPDEYPPDIIPTNKLISQLGWHMECRVELKFPPVSQNGK